MADEATPTTDPIPPPAGRKSGNCDTCGGAWVSVNGVMFEQACNQAVHALRQTVDGLQRTVMAVAGELHRLTSSLAAPPPAAPTTVVTKKKRRG